ncbi:phosphoglycolate phosphatase [Hoeflea marina]|uniref:Phosphoglycolate phosphatase n=1 Tax=Hoeflea marina TaxID=274592 RepID=A0A317PN13_9HYPH|nr:HAD family hydrolase [Hoeflea marina]PWW00437.1 phosphoglycolate phosphatase [Hoeflea marina]
MFTRMAGIVFDKDGTLIDFHRTWEPVIRQAANLAAGEDPALARHLLVRCGLDPDTGVTAPDSLFASANTVEIAAAMVAAGSEVSAESLVPAFDRMFMDNARHAVALTDLPVLFGRLRRSGLKIGIASSDNEASIRSTIMALGAHSLVDFIAGYDSGHGVKPGAGMVNAFCRHTGCAAEMIAVVGDNRHDLEMGRAAGAGLVIGVLTGTGTRESLAGLADHVIGGISDLPGLLSQSES